MLIAVIIVIALAAAVVLALMGSIFGVFGVGNFRADKRAADMPPEKK